MLEPIVSEDEMEQYYDNWVFQFLDSEGCAKEIYTPSVGDRVFDILYGRKYGRNPYGTVTVVIPSDDSIQLVVVVHDNGKSSAAASCYYIKVPKEHDPG